MDFDIKFDDVKIDKDAEEKMIEIARFNMDGLELDGQCPECGSAMKIEIGAVRSCPNCGFEVVGRVG